MTTYIYFVKCPGCEDEHFDFFDEAKEFALGCLSQKPIITQTEVERNDFGECTDSADLGTVWSWEDLMGETDAEPTKSIFTKDDLKLMTGGKDPEFDNLDNSLDVEITEDLEPIQYCTSCGAPNDYSDNQDNGSFIRYTCRDCGNTWDIDKPIKPIPEGMTLESLVETLEEFEDEVECKNCFDLFPKVDCTKHDHGYICPVCGNTTKPSADNLEDTLADLITDEFEAIDGYKAATEVVHRASLSDNEKVEILDTLDHIQKEEEEHIEELKEISGNSDHHVASEEPITLHEDEEEMDEDTVECTWCNDLFDKDQCRYEVNLGWLCSRCEAAIKSRGETLTFKENNYWDFLDENHKPITWICEFDGKEIGTVDAVTEEEAYEAMENKYPDLNYSLYDGVAVVYPADKNELTEASLSDIAAAANSEFGTSWDDDYLLDMAGVDDDFRSIDSFGDTLPKTRKSRELSPEKIAEREVKAAEHERQKNMRFAQRYVAKYGAERYNTQYPVRRQNWRQEWPYYDEATGEFVEGERRDELVKKFEDEQHAKRMAEYEEHHNQPRWYIQTRYNGKWHNLMNTTATTKEDAESWALDYMKNLEAERRAAGGRFDWKETDIRVVAGKGPGPGVPQRFEEDFDPEELHDLGNEYDGGYPNETPEVSNSHLKLCPECGKEAFDTETGICIECGFN